MMVVAVVETGVVAVGTYTEVEVEMIKPRCCRWSTDRYYSQSQL